MKLIKVTASWCMSCIIMNEVLKDIENNYDLNYEVVSYDYDMDQESLSDYNIGKILPVYIKIDNDNEIGRLIGEHSKKEVIDFLVDGGFISE